MKNITLILEFPSNDHLPHLFGSDDQYLTEIEKALHVRLAYRGNQLRIEGPEDWALQAEQVLKSLLHQIENKKLLTHLDVKATLRLSEKKEPIDTYVVRTRKRIIQARTRTQQDYIKALQDFEMVFALGPAGTGKTYLAVARGVEMMLEGKIDRIILSRPAVEAGERLGFLPGDLKEKVDPYLRPLYDALNDLLPSDVAQKKIFTGEIEIAPLAFMRGRTLTHAYVILDEAQNTTPVQMKMFLTRLGEGSRMVITGDMSQVDLPTGTKSGLRDAYETLEGLNEVAFITFSDEDVVRHPLVGHIVRAYEERARKLHGLGTRGDAAS